MKKNSKEYEEAIANFCLFDDTYLNAFFNEQPELVQFVLRIILNNDTLVVKKAQTQKPLKNLHGKSLTLDIYAEDDAGKKYNIEIQRAKPGTVPQRARYQSALLDTNSLETGDCFTDLVDTYVIFLTRNDVLGKKFGKSLPVYRIGRYVDLGDNKLEPFDDGAHILYLNGDYVSDSPIGNLIHDMLCNQAEEMVYPELSERTKQLKEYSEGEGFMCEIMDALVKKEIKRDRVEAIQNLIKAGTSLDVIASSFSISIEEVEDIAKNTSPN